MIYLRNAKGSVFAYETENDIAEYGAAELVRMTPAEVIAHLSQPTPPATREQVEVSRLRAYADPLTGSDRYFAEAQRESLLGNAEAAEAAKALGLARFAEIQAEYPWPAE